MSYNDYMTMLDTNLVDQPLDVDLFSYLTDEEYPFFILGFQLKNLYDQKRLIIKKEYNPVDVIHFVPGETVMPKFFRGIKVQVNKKYDYLIKNLESYGTQTSDQIDKNNYTQLLNEHKLSCNNCFAYLRKGIYPIDSEHLSDLTTCKIKQKDLYSEVLDISEISTFQALGYFVIYVLSNKNLYNISTKNFIHAVVKNYSS